MTLYNVVITGALEIYADSSEEAELIAINLTSKSNFNNIKFQTERMCDEEIEMRNADHLYDLLNDK